MPSQDAAIVANWQRLTHEITQTQPKTKLLVVSKTRSAQQIELLYGFGQRHFAENYWQELRSKQSQLSHLDITWHFTGQLQSNKIPAIAQEVQWVQSVTSIKQVIALQHARHSEVEPLQVCLQLPRTLPEDWDSGSFGELAACVQQQSNLCLRGLMLLPAPHLAAEELISVFQNAHEYWQKLKRRYLQVDVLSMGMSQDWRLALDHGATMVRVGRRIFLVNEEEQ